MRIVVIVALLTSLTGVSRADVLELEPFLRSAEAASLVTVPLRADGEMIVNSGSGEIRASLALIIRPPADSYIELRNPGEKALVLSTGQAQIFTPGASKAGDFPLAASFAGSDFSREDLEPFRTARYKDWRISDEDAATVMVTFYPKDSQYSLVVITFDRDKKVPLKTQYYRETGSNLVKMRRDNNYVMVGRKWMPTAISMESFKLRTRSELTLQWSQNPTFPPELFDAAFLARPSLIQWPAAVPAGATGK